MVTAVEPKSTDAHFGFVIQGMYLTYFMVVKGMLSAFMCSTKNGVSVLTAEPSLSCDSVRSVFPTLTHVFVCGLCPGT